MFREGVEKWSPRDQIICKWEGEREKEEKTKQDEKPNVIWKVRLYNYLNCSFLGDALASGGLVLVDDEPFFVAL